MESPKCPVCGGEMQFMYGGDWDYDRWICAEWVKPLVICQGEIELETTTTPEGMDE